MSIQQGMKQIYSQLIAHKKTISLIPNKMLMGRAISIEHASFAPRGVPCSFLQQKTNRFFGRQNVTRTCLFFIKNKTNKPNCESYKIRILYTGFWHQLKGIRKA
jgi:hypothetical protein